jgi:hypothetical protein
VKKIVINLSETGATIGIQQPQCDPMFYKAEGDLAHVLCNIPNFVKDAETRWQTSKLYPKTTFVAPAPAPAPVRTTVPVNKPAVKPAGPQQPMNMG